MSHHGRNTLLQAASATRVRQEGWQEVLLSMLEECAFERNKMQRDLHTNERKEWEGGK